MLRFPKLITFNKKKKQQQASANGWNFDVINFILTFES